ncbi:UDP-D-xylose:L-fucose alpha-1,3-D-xylosyltransferase 1-like [Patiria miniata]|uniref:Nucleotide-diphospho-sugar transferase domain-containing protein n=1 Tax=Patiria miniata TaxID=46514 RepID=A0A913Z0E9_PATMI|nr:UDP-D-xylose:L-fucose alpha-1,3-D-xylosyltransferase 1-like [Patiria miniata]
MACSVRSPICVINSLDQRIFISVIQCEMHIADNVQDKITKQNGDSTDFFRGYNTIHAPLTSKISDKSTHQRNEKRGPLSNCSLADVRNRSGVVMLTTTNLGFMDMTLNMLKSIKLTKVCVNTTVIAEDQKCYRYLSERAEGDPAVHVVLTNSGESQSEELMRSSRRSYYALFNKRQEYVLSLLEQGLEVLFTDADTFWFRDPFPYFRGDFDMSMIDPRSPYPNRTEKSHYCAGFVYFKPTNVTVLFVNTWINAIKHNDKIGRLLADQDQMNFLLRADQPVHVNVQPLDTNIFPWGPKFYELLAKKANYSTVVMHAASIHGHAAKVKKFKSSNMWLVDTFEVSHKNMVSRFHGVSLLLILTLALAVGCCCCFCCLYWCCFPDHPEFD